MIYHRGTTPDYGTTPRLSQSIANVLLQQSPLHAWQRHAKLGGTPRPTTKALDAGSLVHAMLLGTTAEDVVIVAAADWRTKAAQALRDEAVALGRVPVLEGDYTEALTTSQAIATRLSAIGITLVATTCAEVTATWDEDGVPCIGRFDYFDGAQLVDLKSTRSAHPDAVRKAIDAYGYDVQAVAYHRAALANGYEVDPIRLVFFELEPPFAVYAPELSPTYLRMGERKWLRAVDTWRECLATGHWPGYAADAPLDPSSWALAREMEIA